MVSQKIFRASQWQEWANINPWLWAYLILITGLNELLLLFQSVVKITEAHLASTEYLLVFYNVMCLTQRSYIICVFLHVYCPGGFVVHPFDPVASWSPIPKRLFSYCWNIFFSSCQFVAGGVFLDNFKFLLLYLNLAGFDPVSFYRYIMHLAHFVFLDLPIG